MDFVSSTKAAEDKTMWKGIAANSSMVPRRPSKIMGQNRINETQFLIILIKMYLLVPNCG